MRSKNSPAVLFCVIFGVIILVLFAINLKKIKEVLQQTQFVESVFQKAPVDETDGEQKTQTAEASTSLKQLDFVPQEYSSTSQQMLPLQIEQNTRAVDITAVTEQSGSELLAQNDASVLQNNTNSSVVMGQDGNWYIADNNTQNAQNATQDTNAQNAQNSQVDSNGNAQNTQSQDTSTTEETAPIALADAKLCFMMIDSTGSVLRKEIVRSVPASTAPLTTALNALLAGPTEDERKKGITTLIPDGTALLSASIKDKVAYLNFNDAFQWNKYGVEGYFGQLIQIVYTATTFNSINSVQFLIDGQKHEYLGSEGVWIGTPLSRESFK